MIFICVHGLDSACFLLLMLLVTLYPPSTRYKNPHNLCSTFFIIKHFVLGLGNTLFL